MVVISGEGGGCVMKMVMTKVIIMVALSCCGIISVCVCVFFFFIGYFAE